MKKETENINDSQLSSTNITVMLVGSAALV